MPDQPVDRPFQLAGGGFEPLHRALMHCAIDFDAFDRSRYPTDLLQRAIATWSHHARTEFQSIQVMTRFTQEVVGAGDPIDVYAGAVDAIQDEVRHTALCVRLVTAMGGQAMLPDPVSSPPSPDFLALQMAERAMVTGISMLLINETISSAYIQDLADRVTDPVVHAVLHTILADEDSHHDYGWSYVQGSLTRFNPESVETWRQTARHALQPHFDSARQALAQVDPTRQHLDAWLEPELAQLGLASPARQALVFQQCWTETLRPRLQGLGLWTNEP